MNHQPAIKLRILVSVLALSAPTLLAQINSGSNGSDGVFNPTTNTLINMADHPDGVYNYASVNISNGITVTFTPNANNTPVVWLVQSNCVINGTVDVSGKEPAATVGGAGGPGGYRGGGGGTVPTAGLGPGGGAGGVAGGSGSSGSYAAIGSQPTVLTNGAGPVYGNQFIVPLIGGSGGGGGGFYKAGGGGGGAHF